MAIAAVALLALFFMVPQAWALIEPLVTQTEQTLDANLSLLFTAFLLAIGATFVSWLMARWPRSPEREHYRVVRRFRVG
ncbi:MAG TPA: hypothetical protein VNY05_34180 [Candidatus Acidoferrales bacterium]|jgi:hypothetical protein|nr:hypothetical protein [Candidatus Acidoferrales bacterium]